ncbi:MAG: S41 family peptidase [Crocinitomicaceae bacterium]|nr:S41 family peptidase [Crocinitomicaceae bacterium]
MKFIITLMLSLGFYSLFGQNIEVNSPELAASELQKDLLFWRSKLEKKHPLIYLYRTKNEVDSIFDTSYNLLSNGASEREFYLLLLRISSFIGDGHNGIIPTQSLVNEVTHADKLIPLEIGLSEGKLIINKNLSHSKTRLEGKQLFSINGVNHNNIIDELRSIAPREGLTPLYKAKIDHLFRFYYHLTFGIYDTYEIEYLDHNTIRRETVVGCSLDTIRSRNRDSKTPEDSNPLQFRIIDSLNTAVLTIESFDQNFLKKQYNIKFKKEIKNSFSILKEKQVKSLIIDLRGNNGGNPEFAVDILEQVLREPFELVAECRVVVSKSSEDFYDRTRKKWYPRYGLGSRKPRKAPFSGNIFVLIDESSFSTTVMLSRALKHYNRATLVGNETGGNPIVMGGYYIRTSWKLPNSKITVMPSSLCTIDDDIEKNSGRGILPDITPQEGADALHFTLDMIRKKLPTTKPKPH